MITAGNISLRAVKQSDNDFLYQMINDPDLVHFNAPFRPVHEQSHEDWFQSLKTNQNKEFFIIQADEQAVGSIQLMNIHWIHRQAELSIRIGKDTHRSQGIGSTALQLLADHTFNNLGLIRLYLTVFENNHRAIKAYEKAGFIKEGLLKKAAFIQGSFQDVRIMARINPSCPA